MKAQFGISNDPWIRNGAIILFMHIRKMRSTNEDFSEITNGKIDYNNLSIEYDNLQDLKNIFTSIIDDVRSTYIKTKNKDVKIDVQNDTMETIDRESFSQLTKFFFKGILPQPLKREEYKLEELSEKLQNEYNSISENINQKGMRIYDRCAKLNVINLNDFNHKGHCDFCGNNDVNIDKIKAKYYPFAASLNKYGNFYSNFKSNLNICMYCSLSSFLIYEKLPFLISSKKLFFAVPIINLNFKQFWQHIDFNTGENALNKDYGNIGNKSVDGIFNAFINLIYYLNEKIDEIKDVDIEETKNQWRNLSWMIGNATDKHFINIYTYNDTAKLSNLISKLKNNNINLPALLQNFVIGHGQNRNSIYSNEISRLIMYSQDINEEIEQFYSENIRSGNPRKIKFLNSFVMIYNQEVMNMENEDLKGCYGIGKEIGKYCRGDKDKGTPTDKDMLYELRSCTNLKQFLQFFDRATFKIDTLHISYNFLLKIDDSNWQDLKSIISIFAHQEFYNNKQEEIKNEQ